MLTTEHGREIPANACIVVAENFPGMTMSQWFVAVYYSVAAYDSPYEPILWMPKSGVSAHPQFAEQHRTRHEQNKKMAEIVAQAIRDELASMSKAAA